MSNRDFLRFAAVCALLTALTTLAIHLMPRLWESAVTFEQQLELRNNRLYLANRWIVLVHCVLVIISMMGIRRLIQRDAPELALFGFLGFVVFAFTEVLRTSLVIFAFNRGWRETYVTTSDETVRAAMRGAIEAFRGVNSALFFIFITAFVMGVACYGLALIQRPGSDRHLGIVYVAWAVLSIPIWLDTAAAIPLAQYFGWMGEIFQPAARAATALWLWKKSSESVASV